MDKALQDFILSTLKEGKDFVLTQAPEALQQYLRIQAINQFGWFCISVVLCLILVAVLWNLGPVKGDGYGDKDFAYVGRALIIAVLFICAGSTICNAVNYYEITRYPKGYLLDRALHPSGCH